MTPDPRIKGTPGTTGFVIPGLPWVFTTPDPTAPASEVTIDPGLDPEIQRLRAALHAIRDITGERQDRPWSTLSQIDQIARKALA